MHAWCAENRSAHRFAEIFVIREGTSRADAIFIGPVIGGAEAHDEAQKRAK